MEVVENKLKQIEDAVKNPPKYDKEKDYEWDPKSQFTLTGEQFGAVLHTVRSILNLPEAQAVMWALEANKSLDKLMEEGVEKGILREVYNPRVKK